MFINKGTMRILIATLLLLFISTEGMVNVSANAEKEYSIEAINKVNDYYELEENKDYKYVYNEDTLETIDYSFSKDIEMTVTVLEDDADLTKEDTSNQFEDLKEDVGEKVKESNKISRGWYLVMLIVALPSLSRISIGAIH